MPKFAAAHSNLGNPALPCPFLSCSFPSHSIAHCCTFLCLHSLLITLFFPPAILFFGLLFSNAPIWSLLFAFLLSPSPHYLPMPPSFCLSFPKFRLFTERAGPAWRGSGPLPWSSGHRPSLLWRLQACHLHPSNCILLCISLARQSLRTSGWPTLVIVVRKHVPAIPLDCPCLRSVYIYLNVCLCCCSNMGNTYKDMLKTEEAITCYKKAIEVRPFRLHYLLLHTHRHDTIPLTILLFPLFHSVLIFVVNFIIVSSNLFFKRVAT